MIGDWKWGNRYNYDVAYEQIETNGRLVVASIGGCSLDVNAGDLTGAYYGSFPGCLGFTLGGDRLFSIGYRDSLHIHDFSDPEIPVTNVYWLDDFVPDQLVAGDGLLYTIDGTDQLGVVDVSGPGAPALLPALSTTDICLNFKVRDDYGYALLRAGENDKLAVYSLSDPTVPALMGSMVLPATCSSLEVVDGIVYLPSSSLGLVVVDATDGNSPSLEGTFDMDYLGSFAVNSQAVYTRNIYGVSVLKLSCSSSTTTPVMLSSFRAETFDGKVELKWFTSALADPTDFRLLARTHEKSWEVNFTSDGTSFRALDTTASALAPTEIYYVLQMRDGNAWYTIGQESLTIEVPVAKMAFAAPYPNPFNPSVTLSFTLSEPGHTTLAIYDLAGRLVTTLLDEQCEVAGRDIVWSGNDDSGRPLGAGNYFARLQSGGQTRTTKLVLLK